MYYNMKTKTSIEGTWSRLERVYYTATPATETINGEKTPVVLLECCIDQGPKIITTDDLRDNYDKECD